jgi:hypothetical protein
LPSLVTAAWSQTGVTIARAVRHFLEVLERLTHLNIEFISFRENVDTGGRLAGR